MTSPRIKATMSMEIWLTMRWPQAENKAGNDGGGAIGRPGLDGTAI